LWDNQPQYDELPLPLEGDASHYDHRLADYHWEQPGDLFRKMTPEQKQLLFDNTARAINGASQEVVERHIATARRLTRHTERVSPKPSFRFSNMQNRRRFLRRSTSLNSSGPPSWF
jgi:catalase